MASDAAYRCCIVIRVILLLLCLTQLSSLISKAVCHHGKNKRILSPRRSLVTVKLPWSMSHDTKLLLSLAAAL